MNNYIRGSEWRKWDLHFHTPSSYDYKDKSVSNKTIVEKWKENDISVVAITDHHIIDVDRINELSVLAKAQGIQVLPGIEFCSDSRGDEPLHFIGIFPENSNVAYIWGEISSKSGILGKRNEGKKDNQIYCDFTDTCNLIHSLGGLVSVHAGSKTNSIECITNSLPVKMAEKTDLARCVDFYELGKVADQNDYIKIVFPAINRVIPMVICSDNHDIKDYKFKSNFWIKANPTFRGLKQSLQEPVDRVFIGETPLVLGRVHTNKTKYIRELNIDTFVGKENSENIWFKSIKIPFNHELVAIIGNKGSGKTAISDIIGLCTDSEHWEDFNFLCDSKFKKKGLADRFYSNIEFESGTKTEDRALDYNINIADFPKVQYLPQHYFENVCNEIGRVEHFRKEIEKVVFQYISEEKKLKKNTFNELITFKKESIESEIQIVRNKIELINEEIINLENDRNPENLKLLLSKRSIKEEELRVHNELKPSLVLKELSEEDNPEHKLKKEQLVYWESKLSECDAEIINIENQITNSALAIEELKLLKRELENKEHEFRQFINSKHSIASKYAIDLNKVFLVNLDVSSIQSIIQQHEELNICRKELIGTLDTYETETVEFEKKKLKGKVNHCKKEIALIKTTLSKAEQDYQKSISDFKLWEQQKAKIEGTKEQFDTLEYYKDRIDYIQNKIDSDLKEKRDIRLSYATEIYKKKIEIKTIYDEIKKEIDLKLSECHGQNLTIESSFSLATDFLDTFMNYILKNKVGSFKGYEDGKKILKEKILSIVDWNSEESIKAYLENVIDYLESDKRDGESNSSKATFIGDQIPKRAKFYAFIFSLGYLEPHYELKQNTKKLDELSPGEKGALLLVFYLVLDKSEIPLIIDQPEDNLDNHSVARILVPFIKTAKQQRQIIMVTHNPNLAVVADAEQIINVEINKAKGNEFSFSSGSIEDEHINTKIVNILEGTMPAFKNRKFKYNE